MTRQHTGLSHPQIKIFDIDFIYLKTKDKHCNAFSLRMSHSDVKTVGYSQNTLQATNIEIKHTKDHTMDNGQ